MSERSGEECAMSERSVRRAARCMRMIARSSHLCEGERLRIDHGLRLLSRMVRMLPGRYLGSAVVVVRAARRVVDEGFPRGTVLMTRAAHLGLWWSALRSPLCYVGGQLPTRKDLILKKIGSLQIHEWGRGVSVTGRADALPIHSMKN